MLTVTEFFCWVGVVALSSAFLLSLAAKWGWLEWLQVHAPNVFIERLLGCRFCTSWWMCVAVSAALSLVGGWCVLLAPVCATLITRELW